MATLGWQRAMILARPKHPNSLERMQAAWRSLGPIVPPDQASSQASGAALAIVGIGAFAGAGAWQFQFWQAKLAARQAEAAVAEEPVIAAEPRYGGAFAPKQA